MARATPPAMNSADIRKTFLQYFCEREHREITSSSLVPANDDSLLFTSAGMVQFKDIFLGRAKAPHPRVVSCQRCLRVGGKHNDLEEVGYSTRHHTFFEMLGNFSFGDYFKKEAIELSWGLLTKHFQLPPEKLHITVHHDDNESVGLWTSISGKNDSEIERLGEEDNFWSMGNTGPCGPCTEVFYRHGDGNDKLVEVWNLVFTQYNRTAKGELVPIPNPSVDTGMGLERMAAVLQGVDDNYKTDLFVPIMAVVRELAGEKACHGRTASLKVVADHVRAIAFLICDGIVPSNEGRGYVLRRIMRRAMRHAHLLGIEEHILPELVAPLQQVMADTWPALIKDDSLIRQTMRQEEERFTHILRQGMQHVDKVLQGVSGDTLPGELAFKLYDTYGFPVDLTADIAREHGLNMDMAGFNSAMDGQKQRARNASRFQQVAVVESGGGDTEFVGYDCLQTSSTVVAMQKGEQQVLSLAAGDKGAVIVASTPFYAESGGQVGDRGVLRGAGFEFAVRDTRMAGSAICHLGEVGSGSIGMGNQVVAEVDRGHRERTMRNHSATHLLHAALRKHLGEHVRQQGSLVAADRLRFDFSHSGQVDIETIASIESEVNEIILQDHATDITEMSKEAAATSGAIAMFGEKYGELVRVLDIGGGYSRELCGGTHVTRSMEIGLFKIVSEGAVASGVRRIEAVTGSAAAQWAIHTYSRMAKMSSRLGGGLDDMERNLERIIKHDHEAERECRSLRRDLAQLLAAQMLTQVSSVAGTALVVKCLAENTSTEMMRDIAGLLCDKLAGGIVLLATVSGGDRVHIVAAVGKESPIPANELVAKVAARVGGKGGGSALLAQAGGNQPQHLAAVLQDVPGWLQGSVEGA